MSGDWDDETLKLEWEEVMDLKSKSEKKERRREGDKARKGKARQGRAWRKEKQIIICERPNKK